MQLLFSGEKPDRKAELSDFLQRCSNGNYADVAMSKMRHIIPLFLMEVYADVYGQYSYKGKGFLDVLCETINAVLRTV
jgi:hypothetical protein